MDIYGDRVLDEADAGAESAAEARGTIPLTVPGFPTYYWPNENTMEGERGRFFDAIWDHQNQERERKAIEAMDKWKAFGSGEAQVQLICPSCKHVDVSIGCVRFSLGDLWEMKVSSRWRPL